MNTIKLLPAVDLDKDYSTKMRYNAAMLDYIPATKEEIMEVDYMDLKMLMLYNKRFYEAAIKLLDYKAREIIVSLMKEAYSLEEALNSGYFGESYEDSRHEFVNVLMDHLWD